ncbi:MAG: HAMP domain-containing histidine kinase [Kofleriaceae bacterium]|nr:HAMP domain-containing histidine kinase [Kofleriaceae bacterium]
MPAPGSAHGERGGADGEDGVRLRARLVVATVAVAVPMVIGLIWLDARSRHRAAEDALVRITRARLDEPGARARCEADPVGWSRGPHRHGPGPHGPGSRGPGPVGEGPGPDELGPLGPDRDEGPPRPPPLGPRGAPPRFHAHAGDLSAVDPAAPPLPASVRAALASRDWVAVAPSTFAADVTVAVRTDWPAGPCAIIVTRGTTTPGFLGALLPASPIWLLPLVAVLAMVMLAIGPVVRRIRRLTAQVQAAAATGFTGAGVALDPARDEVGDLSRAFAAATGEVRRQLTARDDRERVLREFLANTTHDTMIPLTVLGQHLAALRDPAVRADPAQVEAKVASAMDEAHYLGALIHNLGVAARVDVAEPQIERSPVDLGALVARVLARHRPIASERGIELDSGVPEAPLRIDADLTMIEQAVSNLVYNAIRYNRRGGHVAVVVDRLAGDRFVVRVLDDGPGIAEAELGRLVERGFRGDAARGRSTGGHGLGLHITHTVARLHGFALAFDNRAEGGLEVTLMGPALPPG